MKYYTTLATPEQYQVLRKIAEKFDVNVNSRVLDEGNKGIYINFEEKLLGTFNSGSVVDKRKKEVSYQEFLDILTGGLAKPIAVEGVGSYTAYVGADLLKVGCVEIDGKKLEEILVAWREMNPESLAHI